MAKTVIRVVRHRRGWRVVSDPASERLSDIFFSKERAVEDALERARRLTQSLHDVSVRVEDLGRVSIESLAP